jgi:hypothetical protein
MSLVAASMTHPALVASQTAIQSGSSHAVASSREDLHLQECAHAGRTMRNGDPGAAVEEGFCISVLVHQRHPGHGRPYASVLS